MRFLKWAAITAVALVVIAASAAAIKIGPSNLIGMLRYDQREEGALRAGDGVPDVELVALDGVRRERVHEWIGNKPVVLIFGSFT